MSTTTSPPVQSFDDKHHFLMRKLHSLSGVIPIGVFLIEHLVTNSMAFQGPEKFNKSVQFIADMPFLVFLEIFGIFLPLAFHAIYGIKIAMSAQPNSAQYPYMANQRFTLQRITGYIAFIFLIVHLAKFRFAHWLGLAKVHYLHSGDFYETTRHAFVDWHPWGFTVPAGIVLAFYVIGLGATCFHFANGLWTFCISWGVTIGAGAQRKFGFVTAGIGIALFVLGLLSLYGFSADREPANQVDHTGRAQAEAKVAAE